MFSQRMKAFYVIRILLCLIVPLLFILPDCAYAKKKTRGVRSVAVGGEDLEIGSFHLLAISIDKYRDKDLNLQTAVAGARELQSVLTKDYTFEKKKSRLLLNADATRGGIIKALRQLAKTAGPNDSVLIYYAGHGHIDDELTKSGSWIPWDATFETPDMWIKNEEIKSIIKAMKARHVLLVSDSCFAGDFFRSQRSVLPQITDANVRRAFTMKSRRAMTAGGIEPVADGGRDGQSVYTWWLLTALRESASPYVLPEDIHSRVKDAVSNNALQNPMYGLLHGAGGEPDASFVFFRRGTAGLDEALKDKMTRIKELEELDRQSAEKLRRQHDEIAGKQRQMEELDRKLAKLQAKVGAGSGQSDLDRMLAMLEQKERSAKELEVLRKKAEEELRAKEAALAEAKQKQKEDRRRKFEADYRKYQKIADSKYATDDFKARAWTLLCKNWGLSEETPVGEKLVYTDRKVTVLKKYYADPVTGMEFVYVKGGCYQMGDTFGDGGSDEKPVHEVCVDDLYMGKYEVTQGQWKKVMGSNPSHFSSCGDNCPVEEVSWDDIQEYIKKLNRKSGMNYRMPTEAEWEYAARSGGKNVRFGTGKDTIGSDDANFDASQKYKKSYSRAGKYRKKTVKVGSFAPNKLGLYDMSGNVWEWVEDWYHKEYYKHSPKHNPKGPGSDWKELNYRVLRGGSWSNYPWDLRTSVRGWDYPGGRDYVSGFRLSRTN